MSKDGKASAKTCEMLPRVLMFPTLVVVQDAFDEFKWHTVFVVGGFKSWNERLQHAVDSGSLSK